MSSPKPTPKQSSTVSGHEPGTPMVEPDSPSSMDQDLRHEGPKLKSPFTVTPIVRKEGSGYLAGSYVVSFSWESTEHEIDRAITYGMALGNGRAGQKLADRMVAACNAGVLFGPPDLRTDATGKTYVSAECKVLARCLSADLKRLGF